MKLRTKAILGAGLVGLGTLLLRRKALWDGYPGKDLSQTYDDDLRASSSASRLAPHISRSVASMLATGTDWERSAVSVDLAEPEVSGFAFSSNGRNHRPSVRAYERQFGHETDDST